MKKEPKKIIDDKYIIPREEMPCEQCGTTVKLIISGYRKTNLSICHQCGTEYEYIFREAPFDAGRDEWA